MPIVIVKRKNLFEKLGKEFTEKEFRDLCFDYGIELDDITSEQEMKKRETGKVDKELSSEVLYKIEIPANRYDLLCEEGLTNGLSIFLGKMKIPKYSLQPEKPVLTMTVKKSTKLIRPFVVCCVLRNISFTKHTFVNNFLQLQEKLHQNIGRKRTLVAIGTHDLDTLKPPFIYDARAPEDIRFVPLDQQKSYDGAELMEFYKTDTKVKHIKPYVHIIEDSSVYPVIYDANETVLSLPPIINGEHTKMSKDTKNVFIEITSTDITKSKIALNMIICCFSQYCEKSFTVEPVKVIYEESGKIDITPNVSDVSYECSLKYMNKRIGINVSMDECRNLLKRMSLRSEAINKDKLIVNVPISRPDIIHACDISEDLGIAYGYNKIKVTHPKTVTVGKEDILNKNVDSLRLYIAMYGYTEIYTLALLSFNDNYIKMNKKIGDDCVLIGNPKSKEFQCVRTSLMPMLLKTISHNQKKIPLPMKFFEINDICYITNTTDTGAINQRNLIVAHCGKTSELEVIHGALDRIMEIMNVPWKGENGYSLKGSENESFFKGMHANVMYKKKVIGSLGVVHPIVLKNFKIDYPVTLMEINIEVFFENTKLSNMMIKKK